MKINPNELTTNKYKAVRSCDVSDKKQSYQANTFKEDLKQNSLNKSKLKIKKKSEIVEISENEIELKSCRTLADILK